MVPICRSSVSKRAMDRRSRHCLTFNRVAVDIADLPVVVSLSPCQNLHASLPNKYHLNLFLIDWSVLLLVNKVELNSLLDFAQNLSVYCVHYSTLYSGTS